MRCYMEKLSFLCSVSGWATSSVAHLGLISATERQIFHGSDSPTDHEGTFSISNKFLILIWRETKQQVYLKSNKIISERCSAWQRELTWAQKRGGIDFFSLHLFHFQWMLKYWLVKRPELTTLPLLAVFAIKQWDCACLMSLSSVIYILEQWSNYKTG